jgi:hypothetical protein
MNIEQFSAAVAMARDSDIRLDHYDTGILMGFGLEDFKQVHIILEVAAATIRWQCATLNGGWDNEAMEECRVAFRHKVIIVGSDHTITPTISFDRVV